MSRIVLTEQASAPATPSSGKVEFYYRSTGYFFYKKSSGTEYQLPNSPVLLSTATASNSATLDFTDLTGYRAYVFDMSALIPATNAVGFTLRISTDNGSTWKSGASDYAYGGARLAGATGYVNSTAATFMGVVDSVSNSRSGVSGRVIAPSLSSGINAHFVWEVAADLTDSAIWGVFGSGKYAAGTDAINGVRFLMTSGNITSGTVRCYGWDKV